MSYLWDGLVVVGFGVAVCGVGLWSVPAALVVGGSGVAAAGYLGARAQVWASSRR